MFNQQKDYRYKKFFFIPFAVVGAVLLFGWVVMLLWNAILPTVTGVSALTYWQAVGLLVLCKILFGGFRGGGRPPYSKTSHWREKWRNMNEEERTQFKAAWRERCSRREG
jgi:hypothetical protein